MKEKEIKFLWPDIESDKYMELLKCSDGLYRLNRDEKYIGISEESLEELKFVKKVAENVMKEQDYLKYAIATNGQSQTTCYADNRDTTKLYAFTMHQSDLDNPKPITGYTFLRWASSMDM